MSWWLWVLITLLAFALGMASILYFQKTHPPDRRKGGDRRKTDRRVAQHALPPGMADRRTADRRSGVDRRKGKPLWQLATVVVSAVFLSIVGVVAYAESQVASIFVGADPDLINSGWAACDTPITWSTDTSRLSAADAKIAVDQLTSDLQKWGEVSGLTFQYVGEVPVIYDDTNYVVTSDVHPSERHLYLAFLKDSDSTLLDTRTVGFASPTKVWRDSKEITEGSVVLSIDYVKKINAKKQSALYLHEIGHALGLGHGTSKDNVMYYLVDQNNTLSPGDIEGIRNLIKACKTGA
ncbi:MAG: matrixin family metalloprotease [Actinomycetales bacterium]|nr:matrixin family metalloprotease [Actinomycetales bacterium]